MTTTRPRSFRFSRFVPLLMLGLACLGWLAAPAAGQFTFPGQDDGPEVTISVRPSVERATPGARFAVAVIFDHADGWHVHTNEPVIPPELRGFTAIPTQIEVRDSNNASVGPVQWPEGKAIDVDFLFTGNPVPYEVFGGRAIAYIPVAVPENAEGELTLEIAIQWQACDDTTCLPPVMLGDEEGLHRVTIPIETGDVPATEAGADFAGFDASVFADADAWGGTLGAAPAAAPLSRSSFFGLTLPPADSTFGIAMLALGGLIGGFILNLTPCVLPVIPIKVLTISQHAGSPGRSMYLGLWMAAGVVGFWLALGVLAASFTALADPSRLFGIWWITLGIGVLIAAMGVGIMGAFNINLPKSVYMVNPKADSASGSFMFGVMTAVLGLPCFGFVAGALLAGSATMPAILILTIFAALGVGMALPYLVLSANPKWIDKLPRTGPASELVKQVMGLLLLAAAAYFVGAGLLALAAGGELPWWAKVLHWWAIALFVAAAAVWLVVRTFQISKKPAPRVSFAIVALLLLVSGFAVAQDQTAKARDDLWIVFSQEALDEALAANRVVVLDFTAEWCLNCKALEASVLLRDPVKSKLLSPGVVPLKADLTGRAAPGWQKLYDLGQTGIPALAIFGPGLEQPWIANGYTPEQVLRAIEQAAGGAELSRAR